MRRKYSLQHLFLILTLFISLGFLDTYFEDILRDLMYVHALTYIDHRCMSDVSDYSIQCIINTQQGEVVAVCQKTLVQGNAPKYVCTLDSSK